MTRARKALTPMDKLTAGYESLMKGKEVDKEGKYHLCKNAFRIFSMSLPGWA